MSRSDGNMPGGDPDLVRRLYESRQMNAIAARWDDRAASWDAELQSPDCHFNHDNAYAWFLDVAVENVRERRELCSGNGVIDCGCGTGLVLEKVADQFSWGIGIDLSPEMIAVAGRKGIRNCRFIAGDCFKLPDLCPRAAAVFSRGILLSHYGKEQGVTLLRAMRGALIENGFVICDFLNDSGRAGQFHAPDNKTYYSREQARQMALEAGFSAVDVVGEGSRRALILRAVR